MKAASPVSTPKSDSKFKRRLVWLLLVVVIPIVASVAMLGGALQFVGIPVLQISEQLLRIRHPVEHSQQSRLQQSIQLMRTQNAALSRQLQAMRNQLVEQTLLKQQMQAQVAKLEQASRLANDAYMRAKQEASVLTTMDPTESGKVLDAMTIEQAAEVVSALSANDAGQMLGSIAPNKAAKIVAIAARLRLQQTKMGGQSSPTG